MTEAGLHSSSNTAAIKSKGISCYWVTDTMQLYTLLISFHWVIWQRMQTPDVPGFSYRILQCLLINYEKRYCPPSTNPPKIPGLLPWQILPQR